MSNRRDTLSGEEKKPEKATFEGEEGKAHGNNGLSVLNVKCPNVSNAGCECECPAVVVGAVLQGLSFNKITAIKKSIDTLLTPQAQFRLRQHTDSDIVDVELIGVWQNLESLLIDIMKRKKSVTHLIQMKPTQGTSQQLKISSKSKDKPDFEFKSNSQMNLRSKNKSGNSTPDVSLSQRKTEKMKSFVKLEVKTEPDANEEEDYYNAKINQFWEGEEYCGQFTDTNMEDLRRMVKSHAEAKLWCQTADIPDLGERRTLRGRRSGPLKKSDNFLSETSNNISNFANDKLTPMRQPEPVPVKGEDLLSEDRYPTLVLVTPELVSKLSLEFMEIEEKTNDPLRCKFEQGDYVINQIRHTQSRLQKLHEENANNYKQMLDMAQVTRNIARLQKHVNALDESIFIAYNTISALRNGLIKKTKRKGKGAPNEDQDKARASILKLKQVKAAVAETLTTRKETVRKLDEIQSQFKSKYGRDLDA